MARKSPADISVELDRVDSAWEGLAPEAVFYGLTLEEFRRETRGARSARTEIENLRRRLQLAIQRRVVADARATRVVLCVVDGVKGHQEYGEDSALYAAMGYVRKGARRKRRAGVR